MDLYKIRYRWSDSLSCIVLVIAESEAMAIKKFKNQYKKEYLKTLSEIEIVQSVIIDTDMLR